MFDVNESTCSLSGPSATAYQPCSSSQKSRLKRCLQLIRQLRMSGHGFGVAEPGGDRGACPMGGIGVALHLAQRERRLGDAAVAVTNAVVRVLPTLVGQPAIGRLLIFDVPVAVAVAELGHPRNARSALGNNFRKASSLRPHRLSSPSNTTNNGVASTEP